MIFLLLPFRLFVLELVAMPAPVVGAVAPVLRLVVAAGITAGFICKRIYDNLKIIHMRLLLTLNGIWVVLSTF
jgi:hypothetical protein